MTDPSRHHRLDRLAPPRLSRQAQSFFLSFTLIDWVLGSPPVGV
jgi:hypothetical protein